MSEVKKLTTIEKNNETLIVKEGTNEVVTEARSNLATHYSAIAEPLVASTNKIVQKESALDWDSAATQAAKKQYRLLKKDLDLFKDVSKELTADNYHAMVEQYEFATGKLKKEALKNHEKAKSFKADYDRMNAAQKTLRKNRYDAIVAYRVAVSDDSKNLQIQNWKTVMSKIADNAIFNTMVEEGIAKGLSYKEIAKEFANIMSKSRRASKGDGTKTAQVWTFVVNDKTFTSEKGHTKTLVAILKEFNVANFNGDVLSWDGNSLNMNINNATGNRHTKDPGGRAKYISEYSSINIKASSVDATEDV